MSRTATAPNRRSLKIRSGDQVKVIAGKDRGKSGRVLRVEPKKERLFVEGLNMIKRHTRPSQGTRADMAAQLGGVIEREGPIHISNLVLLDPKDDKPTRVGIEREDGKRYRISKKTGKRLD